MVIFKSICAVRKSVDNQFLPLQATIYSEESNIFFLLGIVVIIIGSPS